MFRIEFPTNNVLRHNRHTKLPLFHHKLWWKKNPKRKLRGEETLRKIYMLPSKVSRSPGMDEVFAGQRNFHLKFQKPLPAISHYERFRRIKRMQLVSWTRFCKSRIFETCKLSGIGKFAKIERCSSQWASSPSIKIFIIAQGNAGSLRVRQWGCLYTKLKYLWIKKLLKVQPWSLRNEKEDWKSLLLSMIV